jgi:hypothetical protein
MQEQRPLITPKGRILGLTVILLPMTLGALIVFWPGLSDVARYPLQAVFFVALTGPSIALLRDSGRRRHWIMIFVCGGLAAWNLYDASKVWGLIAPECPGTPALGWRVA